MHIVREEEMNGERAKVHVRSDDAFVHSRTWISIVAFSQDYSYKTAENVKRDFEIKNNKMLSRRQPQTARAES